MVNRKRNYKEEAEYENQPLQVKRREARNRMRAKLVREGKLKKGDGKQEAHVRHDVGGTLKGVPAKVSSTHSNEKDQPKHKKHGKNTGHPRR